MLVSCFQSRNNSHNNGVQLIIRLRILNQQIGSKIIGFITGSFDGKRADAAL